MEFIISKKSLLDVLSKVQRVVDKKSSMVIITNFLVEARENGTLKIRGTNLNISESCELKCDVKSPGSHAIPKTLYDIVRNMPEGDVTIKGEGEKVVVKSGRSKFSLLTMESQDFPQEEDTSDYNFEEIDISVLERVIESTKNSMSNDVTRPHLCGALFEGDVKTIGNIVRMVSTDGHRLSKMELEADCGEFSMIVPSIVIHEIISVLPVAKKVQFGYQDGRIAFSFQTDSGGDDLFGPEFMIIARLMENEFPPYEQVIPKTHDYSKVVVGRKSLKEIVNRIMVIGEDRSSGIKLSMSEGALTIEANNAAVGNAKETMDVDYTGEELEIGMNAKYLLDMLSSVLDDEISIFVKGELDPILIRDVEENFEGVIMPLRI